MVMIGLFVFFVFLLNIDRFGNNLFLVRVCMSFVELIIFMRVEKKVVVNFLVKMMGG